MSDQREYDNMSERITELESALGYLIDAARVYSSTMPAHKKRPACDMLERAIAEARNVRKGR